VKQRHVRIPAPHISARLFGVVVPLVDLSVSGAQLCLREALAPGVHIGLELSHASVAVELEAAVVRCMPSHVPKDFLVGVRFLNVTPAKTMAIIRLVGGPVTS
jgi:c-di-GMP-binding flagellar brake protein YcgR